MHYIKNIANLLLVCYIGCMKTIIFASNNKDKISQVKKYFPNYNVVGLKEYGIDIDIPENEDTFEGNACVKAKTIHDMTGECVLADDSGICLDYFDGWPGVHTHRFLGENSTEHQRNQYILEKMKNLNGEDRTCRIICVIAVANNGKVKSYTGEYVSKIATKEFGENSFGFDDIVEFRDDPTKNLACLSDEEKLKINARSLALQQAIKDL